MKGAGVDLLRVTRKRNARGGAGVAAGAAAGRVKEAKKRRTRQQEQGQGQQVQPLEKAGPKAGRVGAGEGDSVGASSWALAASAGGVVGDCGGPGSSHGAAVAAAAGAAAAAPAPTPPPPAAVAAAAAAAAAAVNENPLEPDRTGEDVAAAAAAAASSSPCSTPDTSGGALGARNVALGVENATNSSGDIDVEGILAATVPAPQSTATPPRSYGVGRCAAFECRWLGCNLLGGGSRLLRSASLSGGFSSRSARRGRERGTADGVGGDASAPPGAADGVGREAAGSGTADPDPARQGFTGWQPSQPSRPKGPLPWNGGTAALPARTRRGGVAGRPSRSVTKKLEAGAEAAPLERHSRSAITKRSPRARKKTTAEKRPPVRTQAAKGTSKQQQQQQHDKAEEEEEEAVVSKICPPTSTEAPSTAPPARKQAGEGWEQQLVLNGDAETVLPVPREGRGSTDATGVRKETPTDGAGPAAGKDIKSPSSRGVVADGAGTTASTPAAAGAVGGAAARDGASPGAEASFRSSSSNSGSSSSRKLDKPPSCGGAALPSGGGLGAALPSGGGRSLPGKRGASGDTAAPAPGPAPKKRRTGGGAAAAAARAPAASSVPSAAVVVTPASSAIRPPNTEQKTFEEDGTIPGTDQHIGGRGGGATTCGDHGVEAAPGESEGRGGGSGGGGTAKGCGACSPAVRGGKAKNKSKKAEAGGGGGGRVGGVGGGVELKFLKPDEDHASPCTPTPRFYLPDSRGGVGAAPAVAEEASSGPVKTEGGAYVVWDPRRFVVLDAGDEFRFGEGGEGGGDCGRCCGVDRGGSVFDNGHGPAVPAATVAAVADGTGAGGEAEASTATAPSGSPPKLSADKGKVRTRANAGPQPPNL